MKTAGEITIEIINDELDKMGELKFSLFSLEKSIRDAIEARDAYWQKRLEDREKQVLDMCTISAMRGGEVGYERGRREEREAWEKRIPSEFPWVKYGEQTRAEFTISGHVEKYSKQQFHEWGAQWMYRWLLAQMKGDADGK